MITLVRPTTYTDLQPVMEMYVVARDFMRRTGNFHQWINGYPKEQFIREEIEAGHSFVCENQDKELVGTFCFVMGDDPTYARIYDGEWLNDQQYGAVHRIASSGREKGVADACFGWCFTQCTNIRVDTHRDNHVMQQILKKRGFLYCGIIYLSDGSERMAYQKLI